MGGFARRLQRSALVTEVTPPGEITHGRQVLATNTGLVAAGVSEASLQTVNGATYSTNGQVIEGKLFTGSVVVSGNNVTIRNCKFMMSGQNTKSLAITGSGVRVEYCLFTSSTAVYMQLHVGGANATIYRCNAGLGENIVTIEAGGCRIEESYLHDATNAANPSAHRDTVEVYGGNDTTIIRSKLVHPAGETSTINIAPWWGSTSVNTTTIDDNYIDGGHAHILVDLQSSGTIQNTRVRRNDFGGHTAPNIFGRYAALQNSDGRAISQNETQLSVNPNSILWPSSGADANYWADCSDLVPDRTGQVATP